METRAVSTGDYDGDGLTDVLVGAPGTLYREDPAGGRVYLVLGRRR